MAAKLVTDVRDYLVGEGLIGDETGWDKGIGYMPPTPDQMIVVFETGGFPAEAKPDSSDEQEYDEPTFMIMGRGEAFGYDALRDKMGEIYRSLHESELSPATGDPGYVYVYATQSGPFPLGTDEADNRPRLTWNFRALRERET